MEKKIELCENLTEIKNSGYGKSCTEEELSKYMEKRFEEIKKILGDKNGN